VGVVEVSLRWEPYTGEILVETIDEFIGRVPDRPPLRKQCRLVCGPVYAVITRLVPRSTGYSGSSFSFGFVHVGVHIEG
jgi:hypothetical protein